MTAHRLAALLVAIVSPVAPADAQPARETAAARMAAGVWAYRDRTGKVLPSGSFTGTPADSLLTPAALAARQAFDFRTDDPVQGCGAPGMPRALTAGSPMSFAWVDGDLEIRYESMDVRRSVQMGGAPPAGASRTPNGFAVGRWDGDTLIVTTTLLDGRVVDLLGTPKSEAMTLEERYRIEESGGETRASISK
jgi:hypothetical protein